MASRASAAARVLSGVEGVSAFSVLAETGGTVRLSVHTSRDVREELFFAFAAARLPVLELRPRTASLEEVFLDLTDDDDQVAAAALRLLTGRGGKEDAQ